MPEAAAPKDAKAAAPVAPLPPWQPTKLAHYSRKFKITVLLVFLVLIGWMMVPSDTVKTARKLITKIESADKQKPHENIAPVPVPTGDGKILNEQDDRSIKLAAAPDLGLSEDSGEGSLPRVGEDGRQPWQVYARPFNSADQRPKIAIVMMDLGLARIPTDAAINRLPANVTLAFDTQAPSVGAWGTRARDAGHETLLQIPMEPFDYPRSDPGPGSLLTTLPNTDNIERFLNALRQATGYVGITTMSGSRFTTSPEKLGTILSILRQRGLLFLDPRIAPHSAVIDMSRNMKVPAVLGTMRIDQDPTPASIDSALDQLEKTARLNGQAVGIATPLPITIERLQEWLKDLPQKGIALAPVSALVK